MFKIAFAGNPNVGKSALINALAGSKLKVGNWPGVTVEKKEARFTYNGVEIEMIDLPGVYSLSPYSLEERVTREYIETEKPDIIINVLDSTNLERNLYLTTLLKEFKIPMILALNFYDEFEKLDYKLDLEKFQDLIGIQAVKTSALREDGLKELLEKAVNIAKNSKKSEKSENSQMSEKHVNSQKNQCDSCPLTEDEEITLTEKRYGIIRGILAQTLSTSLKNRLDFTDKIDRILLNQYLGLPIFLLTMAGLMTVVFNGATPFIDWIDGFIGDFLAKYIGHIVDGVPAWLHSLIVDGIIGGLGGIVVFVPLMFFLYFFLAILEESGYMSRVAFLMDKIMRSLGLNGKAFVPMIIGFGCSVPAIYATRTLEDEKSRKLTSLMAPFMSCGARLPVYGLFTAAFFGAQAGFVIMTLYILGIVVAITLGMILKRFNAFKVDEKALIIELPPYRVPTYKMVMNSTLDRTGEYLKKASTTILAVLMLLWALTYFPNSGETSKSYMASIGKTIAPILKPTGFADRWETVAAIPPSIAAKEIVVGFMAQVLKEETIEEDKNKNEGTSSDIIGDTSVDTDSIVSLEAENLEEVGQVEKFNFAGDLLEQIKGLGIATIDSAKGIFNFNIAGMFAAPEAEELEEESRGVVTATKSLWPNDPLGPLKAYSFMAFILLVVPCVVTLAALKHEFGIKFMWFVTGVMLVVPYVVSTLIFQIGRLFYL